MASKYGQIADRNATAVSNVRLGFPHLFRIGEESEPYRMCDEMVKAVSDESEKSGVCPYLLCLMLGFEKVIVNRVVF